MMRACHARCRRRLLPQLCLLAVLGRQSREGSGRVPALLGAISAMLVASAFAQRRVVFWRSTQAVPRDTEHRRAPKHIYHLVAPLLRRVESFTANLYAIAAFGALHLHLIN